MRQPIVREPAIPTVVVNARGRARVLAGHPWVFRQDVLSGQPTDARSGGPALVAVLDERRRPLASATWATLSPVALRILQRRSDSAPMPGLMELIADRLHAALAWRQRLARDRDALRLVHGEADGLLHLPADIPKLHPARPPPQKAGGGDDWVN